MWLEDLTPHDIYEVPKEEWERIAEAEYDTWFRGPSLPGLCGDRPPPDSEITGLQTCRRRRGHLGAHVCGGMRFSYTKLRVWYKGIIF